MLCTCHVFSPYHHPLPRASHHGQHPPCGPATSAAGATSARTLWVRAVVATAKNAPLERAPVGVRVEIEIWGERWARTGNIMKYLSTTSEVPNSSDLVDRVTKRLKSKDLWVVQWRMPQMIDRKTTIIHSIEGWPWVPIVFSGVTHEKSPVLCHITRFSNFLEFPRMKPTRYGNSPVVHRPISELVLYY